MEGGKLRGIAGKWRPHAHSENSKNFSSKTAEKMQTEKYLKAASTLEKLPNPEIPKYSDLKVYQMCSYNIHIT